MEQRERFIDDSQRGLYDMTELCARYAISRKTGYKWVARYDAGGRPALRNRSRAPHVCPHKIPAAVAQLLLTARRQHPDWGPEKLLQWLEPRHPAVTWPAVSTAGDLLARHGLVQKRRRRRPQPHPGVVPPITTAPNDLWATDFKGQFRTGDRIPQALHGCAARHSARSRSVARVSRRQDGPRSAERAEAERSTAAAASAPAWASPARRSPSTSSGGPDSEAQSRRSRSRAPAPCSAPAPAGSAARPEKTACRSGSPSRWTARASPRAATRDRAWCDSASADEVRRAGACAKRRCARQIVQERIRARVRDPNRRNFFTGDPDASRDCARPGLAAANSRR